MYYTSYPHTDKRNTFYFKNFLGFSSTQVQVLEFNILYTFVI